MGRLAGLDHRLTTVRRQVAVLEPTSRNRGKPLPDLAVSGCIRPVRRCDIAIALVGYDPEHPARSDEREVIPGLFLRDAHKHSEPRRCVPGASADHNEEPAAVGFRVPRSVSIRARRPLAWVWKTEPHASNPWPPAADCRRNPRTGIRAGHDIGLIPADGAHPSISRGC
jgi:hypothetical protein